MSNAPTVGDPLSSAEGPVTAGAPQSASAPMSAAPQEKLEDVEDIDFLLEEIENKIAPLALA